VTQLRTVHCPFYYSGRSNALSYSSNKCGLTVSNFRLMQITKKQGPFVAKSLPGVLNEYCSPPQIANPVALAETPLCGYTPPPRPLEERPASVGNPSLCPFFFLERFRCGGGRASFEAWQPGVSLFHTKFHASNEYGK